MLIRALCDYYDTLASHGKVIPDGFSQIGVTYLITLKENGEIGTIIDIRNEDEKGKKKPRQTVIPKRDNVPAIHSEIIDQRGLYIFGLNYDKTEKVLTPNDPKDEKKKNDAARKKHEAYVKTNLDFIQDLHSPVVDAFRQFLLTWNPMNETNNPALVSLGKDIDSANFTFCLYGYPEILLHEDQAILGKWNAIYNESNIPQKENVRHCAILGEHLEIARLHDKIKGIIGGQASGTNVICFNNDSENSYGNEQSFNSNVSVQAMRRYTEALNYLLASKHNHSMIEDTTVVFWAQNGDEKADDLMSMLTLNTDTDAEIDDEVLSSLIKDCRNGTVTREKLTKISELDVNTDYYFVGIKPNSSRLSIKFFYRKELGQFLWNAVQHQTDMKIVGLEKAVPLWRLEKELLTPNSKNDTGNPALTAKIFDAILNGTPYPDELLRRVIQRVKIDIHSDKDDKDKYKDIRYNAVRAGIIKACINRIDRKNKKEDEISMALDKENTNQAYLCGRLFAVLEKIQQKASNYSLNRTIKDAYFASAVARPAGVFPKIIKLSNYHLSKLNNPKYFRDEMMEIMDKIGSEFPASLSLAEQGKFILGYYHQINNKNNNNNNTEEQ